MEFQKLSDGVAIQEDYGMPTWKGWKQENCEHCKKRHTRNTPTVRETTETLERLMVIERTGGIKIGKYEPQALNMKIKQNIANMICRILYV